MPKKQTPPGPGVDANGQSVVDPTKNVYALVSAETRRQDDLRNKDAEHQEKLADIRDEHARELRLIEAGRLDAIRNVDNVAVQRAAEVSATQAATLAQTLAQTAEAMRTQVAAAATVTATALDAKIAPLQNAIADLQRFQFEAQGQKTQVIETRAGSGANWIVVGGLAGLGALFLLALSTGLAIYFAVKP